MNGGIGWVAAVNVIVWTGLFLYLLRLGAQVRKMGRNSEDKS